MEKKEIIPLVIGVDHGFNYMKTVNSTFESGVVKMAYEPPININCVEYKGEYYVVGGSRKVFHPNKVQNEDYYILTLAAIAQELKARGRKTATIALAVGLPLKREGVEKEDFISYLRKEKEVSFKFSGESYHVKIVDVKVFPQGYAIILPQMEKMPKSFVCADLGGGTFDVTYILDTIPDMSRTKSYNGGVITAIEMVQEEIRTLFGTEIEEYLIKSIVMGEEVTISKKYKDVVIRVLKQYANTITGKLIEMGFNLDTTHIVWCGGGANLIKNFSELDPDMNTYILDTKANAKGFEFIYKQMNGKK